MTTLKAIRRGSGPISDRLHAGLRAAVLGLFSLGVALVGGGCATVRPQERAILADPMMRFDSSAKQDAELQHVLDNREGSFGGGAVQGGGCGCN